MGLRAAGLSDLGFWGLGADAKQWSLRYSRGIVTVTYIS